LDEFSMAVDLLFVFLGTFGAEMPARTKDPERSCFTFSRPRTAHQHAERFAKNGKSMSSEAAVAQKVTVSVGSHVDVIAGRQEARKVAQASEFTAAEIVLVATAASEIARYILANGSRGELTIQAVHTDDHAYVELVGRFEESPYKGAVNDSATALQATRRIVDYFEIVKRSQKIEIIMRKYGGNL
jgi:hypothetical protein